MPRRGGIHPQRQLLLGDDGGPVRIWRPSADPPAQPNSTGLSAAMRLSEFFQKFFEPVCLAGRSPATVASYRESLHWWTEFTGDPPLADIDDYTTAGFVKGLTTAPGRPWPKKMANFTKRKHCRQIQTLLDRAGPRTRDNRRGQSLLGDPPFIEAPPAERQPPKDCFTAEEIRRMLAAAAEWPRPRVKGVTPGDWWKGLLLAAAFTGLRIGTLMRLTWDMLSIVGSQLGLGDVANGAWLEIPPGIAKKSGQRKFVAAEALAAIERLRPKKDEPPRKFIFPWPNWNLDTGRRWLQENRRRIQEAAGMPKARQFGFHGFRRWHATELAEINPAASRLSLGHTNQRTTDEHYLNPRIVAEAIKRLPRLGDAT